MLIFIDESVRADVQNCRRRPVCESAPGVMTFYRVEHTYTHIFCFLASWLFAAITALHHGRVFYFVT